MISGLVIGNNITVPSDVERIVSINRDDHDYTTADDGKMFIAEDCEISATGAITAPVFAKYITKTANFATDDRWKVYYVDATAGNITVTLNVFLDHIFVRKDATGNTVTLTPASGTINGAASASLNGANTKYHVVTDGTNYNY